METLINLAKASPAATVASIVAAILIAGYYYYQNQFKFFKRHGLSGPKPYPIVGNVLSMLFESRMQTQTRWARKFGKLYGIFQGVRPRFVVADAELIRQICIKDFDVFPNHEFNRFLNIYQRRFIFFLQGDEWKRMRALQTPTFTSGKIKRMFPLLNRCGDDLVASFREQLESSRGAAATAAVVNLKQTYDLFTMDAIASCGYGLKLERLSGATSMKTVANRDEFVANALRMFELNIIRVLLLFAFHTKFLDFFGFRLTPEKYIEPLVAKTRHIVATRRRQMGASNKKFDDYLQLLVDARLDDQMELNEMDTKENHHAGLTQESLLSDQQRLVQEVAANGGGSGGGGANGGLQNNKSNGGAEGDSLSGSTSPSSKMTLSDEDILCSAVFLLVVGLETTATLLTSCTYTLAFHPEVQERLHEELSQIAELDASKTSYLFDYEALTSCKYLDAVISETLRVLPPVVAMDRVAQDDYRVEKYNVTIAKGGKLHMDYYAVLNDPDYWQEPEKFRPERFMPGEREKIVPGSYCPFGLGPRHCLGMRFSLTETKVALAKVLMLFRFKPAPNTSYPPAPKLSMALNEIKTPLVTVEWRNSSAVRS